MCSTSMARRKQLPAAACALLQRSSFCAAPGEALISWTRLPPVLGDGSCDQRDLGTASRPFPLAVSIGSSPALWFFFAQLCRGGEARWGPRLLQGRAGCEALHVRRAVLPILLTSSCSGPCPCSVLHNPSSLGQGRAEGQRQRSRLGQRGCLQHHPIGGGGASCTPLSPGAVAKHRCSGDAASLPIPACARIRAQQDDKARGCLLGAKGGA